MSNLRNSIIFVASLGLTLAGNVFATESDADVNKNDAATVNATEPVTQPVVDAAKDTAAIVKKKATEAKKMVRGKKAAYHRKQEEKAMGKAEAEAEAAAKEENKNI